jgi:N-acylneuraminate cytidylyltransferase/CMP-N,N'-diacetyllegionaminic acid synthase
MINGKSVLALIPARGGSKGLPGKNIRPLLGKPLLAWSVEQGKASQYIDKVMVSTDDTEIAGTAKKYGAEVPFLRPAELASDTAPTIDTILNALDGLAANGEAFDFVVLLEPTSPLREVRDIDRALEKLSEHATAESIVGVAKVESAHPAFLLKVENGLTRPYSPNEFGVKRRQDIEDVFFLEGSVYIAYAHSLRDRRTFYHELTLPYIVPKYKSFEIDDLTDFTIVEALMKARLNGALSDE